MHPSPKQLIVPEMTGSLQSQDQCGMIKASWRKSAKFIWSKWKPTLFTSIHFHFRLGSPQSRTKYTPTHRHCSLHLEQRKRLFPSGKPTDATGYSPCYQPQKRTLLLSSETQRARITQNDFSFSTWTQTRPCGNASCHDESWSSLPWKQARIQGDGEYLYSQGLNYLHKKMMAFTNWRGSFRPASPSERGKTRRRQETMSIKIMTNMKWWKRRWRN